MTKADRKKLADRKRKELLALAETVTAMRESLNELLPDTIAASRQLSEAAQHIRNASIILHR